MTLAVAMKEWLTVTTSSPGRTPTASSARCSAVVPLETAQAWRAPTYAANSRSKAATSGPCVTQPERMARPAAWTSASSMSGFATGIIGLASDTGSPDGFDVRAQPAGQAGQPFLEPHLCLEPQQLPRTGGVGQAAPHLHRLPLRRQRDVLRLDLRAHGGEERIAQLAQRRLPLARDVEDLVGHRCLHGEDVGPGHVLHVDEVHRLIALPEDEGRLPLLDESVPADEDLGVLALGVHAWTVDVEVPHGHVRQTDRKSVV